jgi:hypothetical protein
MNDEPEKPPVAADDKIEFHYQKTSQYRGIHMDGFWGGPTPRGGFAISFFSERQPIPRHAERQVLDREQGGATLGGERVTEVLSGVVRQVEATVYTDLKTLQEFYTWLGPHVAKMEEFYEVPENERVAEKGNK